MTYRHFGLSMQIAFVILLSASLTLIIFKRNYLSPLNLLWMIIIPILVGMIFNSSKSRLWMSTILVGCSLISQMITAAYFGLGY